MRQLTIERLAEAILFILLFTMAVRVPLDTDVWWHLEAGNYFWDEGKILQEDIFSHTQAGQRWINHSWGGQIILSGIYRLTGGGDEVGDSGRIGLALYTAFFATAGMGLVYRMCAGNVYSKAFVMVLGAATAAVFWSPRPQMISFFLSTVVLWILHQYKYHRRERAIWFLPPLMVLWVNLHAGFAIGFIYLFGFIVGEMAGNLLNPEDEFAVQWGRVRNLAIIMVISVLALSLNPFGVRMMAYPFETAGLQTLNLFISEWLSPNFKNPQTWTFILMVLAIIVLASRTQPVLTWTDLSLTSGTFMLALFASRNLAVFAVAATPVLARALDQFLREKGWIIRPMKQVKGARLILNWTLLGVIILGALAQMTVTLSEKTVDEAQEEFLPLAALDYLKANPPQGNLLNHYNWGGLLIFETDIPVFVDGRTDLYGDKFLEAYFRAMLGASEWREIFEDYQIEAAFLESESALTTLLREDEAWELVYVDELATIFVKKAE